MKTLIFTIICVSLSNTNYFDKMVLPYSIVTSKTDLIVEGTIDEIYDGKYGFTISDFIKGKDQKTIYVTIGKQWTCDIRKTDYKKGQKLILFLIKENGKYQIINGSTGELIINDDGSILRHKYQPLPDLTILKDGIKMLIKSIDYNGELYSEGTYKFLVSQSEFEKYKNENSFYYQSTRGLEYVNN
ncbi:hypothetical protein M0G43_08390 [Subsaxibacter sp. CAU 1640]|uniref:hypothetical protein n=1 Tax=Subsaxibacter sp. CAU 1640 TaxID=2933271 RepID=UPI00200575D3|nr:hypothetical protein [Subsaxibacter sp. CAU 1640]MCK7590588.1 hypothetical protein [Subsaxibacter sp. CAU 1640]